MNVQGNNSAPSQLLSKDYCTKQVKSIVDNLRDNLTNLAEKVCLAYLDEPAVIKQFKSSVTAVIGAAAFSGKAVSKEVEESYFKDMTNKIDSIVNAFVNTKTISTTNLYAFEQNLLTAFTSCSLFKYYDSINNIEKLKKRVKKIDD